MNPLTPNQLVDRVEFRRGYLRLRSPVRRGGRDALVFTPGGKDKLRRLAATYAPRLNYLADRRYFPLLEITIRTFLDAVQQQGCLQGKCALALDKVKGDLLKNYGAPR